MNHNRKLIPIQKLIPSFVTISSLCLGITSIKYALDANYNIAISLIILAGVLDGIDGRIARYLNTTSKFGAQLDSLSDMCSFGVSPAVVIYLWSLHQISYKGIGWALVLFYITCSSLRLARFNITALSNEEEDKSNERIDCFFQGLPIPAAAIMLLMPLMLTFSLLSQDYFDNYSMFIAGYLLIISLLMVSKIPVYSGKKINIDRDKVKFILVFIGVLITSIILEPWIFIPLLSLVYILVVLFNIYLLYVKKSN